MKRIASIIFLSIIVFSLLMLAEIATTHAQDIEVIKRFSRLHRIDNIQQELTTVQDVQEREQEILRAILGETYIEQKKRQPQDFFQAIERVAKIFTIGEEKRELDE